MSAPHVEDVMRKIPTLFIRDPQDMKRVLPEINPGCEWVLAGEGVATRKYDGTCVMLDKGGRWWARREVKVGKPVPAGWVGEDYDPITGNSVGWVPIDQSGWAKWHAEALAEPSIRPAGTYELCGLKVQGNPEGLDTHKLIRHAEAERRPFFDDLPSGPQEAFTALSVAMAAFEGEGIVWHHPDGRMAKLKARDFAR